LLVEASKKNLLVEASKKNLLVEASKKILLVEASLSLPETVGSAKMCCSLGPGMAQDKVGTGKGPGDQGLQGIGPRAQLAI
jgi:hypothetical protein